MAEARTLADQAFSRAAARRSVTGNAVRLLCDAGENYPAWLDAIERATRHVHFETYIVHEDAVGRALRERARGEGARRRRGARPLRLAGRAREYLAPLLAAAAGRRASRCAATTRRDSTSRSAGSAATTASASSWTARSRSSPACAWAGCGRATPRAASRRGATPASRCAARRWPTWRAPSPTPGPPAARRCPRMACRPRAPSRGRRRAARGRRPRRAPPACSGSTSSWPRSRAARLWLTDAYFAGMRAYVQALRAAALDGVDVRLLVPGRGSDIPVMQAISRAGYRAAARGRRPRLRVERAHGPREDRGGGRALGARRLHQPQPRELDRQLRARRDRGGRRLRPRDGGAVPRGSRRLDRGGAAPKARAPGRGREDPRIRGGGGSASRAAAGALRLGNAVGAALSPRRLHKSAPRPVLVSAGLALVALALMGAFLPQALAWPLAALALWLGLVLLLRAMRASSAVR